jgi:hypothetical protein
VWTASALNVLTFTKRLRLVDHKTAACDGPRCMKTDPVTGRYVVSHRTHLSFHDAELRELYRLYPLRGGATLWHAITGGDHPGYFYCPEGLDRSLPALRVIDGAGCDIESPERKIAFLEPYFDESAVRRAISSGSSPARPAMGQWAAPLPPLLAPHTGG